MKITKLEIKDFGKFTGNIKFDDIDGRIALFYGENEAGKTTIFNLIKAIFYGFYPASCDSHPYASWDNERIEFTAHILNRDEDEVVVNRKLISTPRGKCIIGDTHINLRNKTLPWAEHISYEIFDKIYSLRVEDLIEIQGKAWDEVEDKLLANYGTEYIKSSRDVLKEIKKECDDIWRESNRGKFLIKELKNEIKELKKVRKDILKKEEDIRELDSKIDNLNVSINSLKDKKYSLKAKLIKSKELKPIKDILDEISSYESKYVAEEISLIMPTNIRESFEELENRIDELKSKREKIMLDLQKKKNEKYVFTDMDEEILLNKVKINILSKEHSNIQGLKLNIENIIGSIEGIKGKLVHEGDSILEKEWNDDIRQKFDLIRKSDLQILVNRFREKKQELKEMKWKRDLSANAVIEVKFSKAYLYSLIFSIVLIIGGLSLDSNTLQIFGLAGIFYGLTGIVNYNAMKKKYERSLDRNSDINIMNKNIKKLEVEKEEAKERLINYLNGIPISDLTIENMDDLFLSNMLKIMDIVYELKEMERKLFKTKMEYQNTYKDFQEFINKFSFEEYIKEEERIFYLKERVEELERRKILSNELERNINETEKELKSIQARIDEFHKKYIEYRMKIQEIGNGDIKRGIETTEENFKIKNRIEGLKEKLDKYENVDVLIKEIKKYGDDMHWLIDEYNVTKIEDELEEINEEINNLEIERAKGEEVLKQLEKHISLDEIESKIYNLEDEVMRAYRKRDRLALLTEIIKIADQNFREENQPNVLKNASKYFNIMTAGRYTDLFIDNEEKRGIMVKRSRDTMPIKVGDTFSKGTLNQLYLSLRLSLVDHLDRNNEQLPIALDELLVNWDRNRLNNSLKLLNEISQKRQVFIFTCHDWMAEKIEKTFSIDRKIV